MPRDHALAQEEVFGPVLSVFPFEDEADGLALANGTHYGLVAGIWDPRRGALDAGWRGPFGRDRVYVNGYGAGRWQRAAFWRLQEIRSWTREGL